MKRLIFLALLVSSLSILAQTPPPLKTRADGSFTQGDTYLAVLKGLQIPSGATNTLTGSGTRVNLFYNTTDKVLYIHNGVAWKAAIEADLTPYYTKTEVDALLANKQSVLISGTNLKSINSNSLLGSGNLVIDKTSIGLGNVDNTTDLNKPISTATQTALNAKEPLITAGTTSQYRRGDKTWQTLDKTAMGLANVDNTSDVNKPISTATQTALNAKEPLITAGTTSQYRRGDKTWQTLDKTAMGLANVDNTSDVNKPISTATQTALNAKEPLITAGTTAQYRRGDKTWQTLNSSAVGLGNVNNTADASKNVLSASSLTTARTINGVAFNGTANITVADETKVPYTGFVPIDWYSGNYSDQRIHMKMTGITFEVNSKFTQSDTNGLFLSLPTGVVAPDNVGGLYYADYTEYIYYPIYQGLTFNGSNLASLRVNDVEITSSSAGIILKSPNGTRYRITIDDAGNFVKTVAPL